MYRNPNFGAYGSGSLGGICLIYPTSTLFVPSLHNIRFTVTQTPLFDLVFFNTVSPFSSQISTRDDVSYSLQDTLVLSKGFSLVFRSETHTYF